MKQDSSASSLSSNEGKSKDNIFHIIRIQKHNIIAVIAKLDATSFIRFRRVCKGISQLIEDTVGRYQIRMGQNITISYQEVEPISQEFAYKIKKDNEVEDTIAIRYSNFYDQVPHHFSIEQVLHALRGLIWWKLKMNGNYHLYVGNDRQAKALQRLGPVLDIIMPHCKMTILHFTTPEVIEIAARERRPDGMDLQSETHNVKLLPRIDAFRSVKDIDVTCFDLKIEMIQPFFAEKRSCIFRETHFDSTLDWSGLNAFLRRWQTRDYPMEYLRIESIFPSLPVPPPGLVDGLDLIDLYDGRMKEFSKRVKPPGNNRILAMEGTYSLSAWLLRTKRVENGYPVFGLLSIRVENDSKHWIQSMTITFRKLLRSPGCSCKLPICSEYFASLFYHFILTSFPIDLRAFKREVEEIQSVEDLQNTIDTYLRRLEQCQSLSRQLFE